MPEGGPLLAAASGSQAWRRHDGLVLQSQPTSLQRMSLVKTLIAASAPLRVPFQALLVAAAGVGMAWLFLNGHWLLGAVITVIPILLGLGIDAVTRYMALPAHPVLAVYLLQSWLLIPLAIAVVAAAAALVLTIELTVPK